MVSPTVALGIELPKEVEEFINLIFWGYNPITEALPVFQDEQLMRLMMPIIFIAGKNDIMVDAVTAAQRLGKLIPNAEGHLLTLATVMGYEENASDILPPLPPQAALH